MDQNIKVARQGGSVAKNARQDLEAKLGKSVISPNNNKYLNLKETNENLEVIDNADLID